MSVPQRPAPRLVFDRGKPKVKIKTGKPTTKVKHGTTTRMRCRGGRHVYVLDLFAGTCTSAALYALRRHPHARVVCVDRDRTLEWVRRSKLIPERYLDRLLIINDDIRRLDENIIMEHVRRRWPTARWHDFVHVHASPSCRSYSRADRGFSRHRDARGRPLTRLARQDDAALRRAVSIMLNVKRKAPGALYTLENPVSRTWKLVPCLARLCKRPEWRWLTVSYCKVASKTIDSGDWPRKNSNILACHVPKGLTLPQCEDDCDYLVDRIVPGRRRRHKIVICNNRSNWPEQHVERDVMRKGMIPHGLFQTLERAHGEWLAERKKPLHMARTRAGTAIDHDTAANALVDLALTTFVHDVNNLQAHGLAAPTTRARTRYTCHAYGK